MMGFSGIENLGKSRYSAFPLMLMILLAGIVLPGCKSDPYKTKSFKNVFDHYRGQEEVDAISFPPGLVGLFLNDSDPDQAEIKKLMQDLSAFRMLILKGDEQGESGSADEALFADGMREAVIDFTNRNGFQDLFRMQSAGQDIFIRIQEKEGMVKEAILMLESDGSLFVIDLKGDISLQHFTALVEGGYLSELTSLGDLDF